MLRLLLTCCICFTSILAFCQTGLWESLENLKEECTTRGEVSALVSDLETGEILLAHKEDKLMVPASTQKLIVTGAALGLLGPEYRFRTQIIAEGRVESGSLTGDLVILPGADPTFLDGTDPELKLDALVARIFRKLNEAGINRIEGDIRVQADRFDRQAVPDGWIYQDLGNYYAAGAWPLNFAGNSYSIEFRSGKKGSRPEVLRLIPPLPLDIDNRLVAEGNSDQAYIYPGRSPDEIFIKGSIPPGRKLFRIKGSIPNPPLLVARRLKELLENKGVATGGEARVEYRRREAAQFSKVLAEVFSPPLKDIVKDINFESLNMYAEALVLAIGLEKGESGTFEEGWAHISGFWEDCGMNPEVMRLKDGSGLSPANRLSASFLVGILQAMYYTQNRNHYTESLPLAGKEGTVAYLPVAKGNCLQLKSGSMSGHMAYAGYKLSGRKLAFAVLVNDYDCPPVQMRRMLGEFLSHLCEY